MAATVIANASAIAACNAIVDLVDVSGPGLVKIYDDTAPGKPADPGVAVTSQVLLATLTFSGTAFGAAADATPGGRATASTITADSSADASGTAAWFRVTNGAALAQWDGDITTTGVGTGDMLMNSTTVASGAIVSISSFTFTVPES